MQSAPELTPEELLHLAIHAGSQNAPEKAIAHLKQVVALEPENAQAHYLLGAFHAEIGMFVLAAEELEHALRLAPNMDTARFQLGLLQLTGGDLNAAAATWEPLETLDADAPLRLFKEGMLSLAHDEFGDCMRLLERGIANNTENENLNDDMLSVLERARALLSDTSQVNDEKQKNSAHVFLSAYQHEPDERH